MCSLNSFATSMTSMGSPSAPITLSTYVDLSTTSTQNEITKATLTDTSGNCGVTWSLTLPDPNRSSQSIFSIADKSGDSTKLVATGVDSSQIYGLKEYVVRGVLANFDGSKTIDVAEASLYVNITNPCLEVD